ITVGKGVIQLAKRRVMRLRASEDAPAPDTQDGDDEPTSRLEKLLTSAEEQMDRLTRLVNDLLDFSRIRAGKLNLRLGACDLSALMCELAEEQRAMHPGRRIEVAFPAHGGPHVLADCARLGQVITNYLTNALNYSPADCPVAVGLDVDNKGCVARVWVRDHGPGLPRGELERIWEPFHRAGGVEALHEQGAGLGLGLHISRDIVERHGGRVGVESKPGEGSIFFFTLPL